MISEVFFSTQFTSLWRSITPAMEDFVRRLNMDGYKRVWPPLPSSSRPDHRGAINEAAFMAFAETAKLSRQNAIEIMRSGAIDRGFYLAFDYIYRGLGQELGFFPDSVERREAFALAGRLHEFFSAKGSDDLEISPMFLGSGIISSCRGDLYDPNSNILYEVKSGNRNVRSVDIRQCLVYCSLAYASKQRLIEKISIVNPRKGTHYLVELEDLALEISGQGAAYLFQTMSDCFSEMSISV